MSFDFELLFLISLFTDYTLYRFNNLLIHSLILYVHPQYRMLPHIHKHFYP